MRTGQVFWGPGKGLLLAGHGRGLLRAGQRLLGAGHMFEGRPGVLGAGHVFEYPDIRTDNEHVVKFFLKLILEPKII